MYGWIFYILAIIMAANGAGDTAIFLVFFIGMLCHWRAWGLFIIGIMGGYWLTRN